MRVPLSWLSEHVSPVGEYAAGDGTWNVDRLVDRLVMTGTEIEAIHTIGPESVDSYVVGRVESVGEHPDADRLSVCDVDTGDGRRTIVCGAPNVAAGQAVPVALPGAVLPGAMKITAAKLRGVESNGMILSEQELGIGEDGSGIMVLDSGEARSGPDPGTPLSQVIALSDTVLELEITPNRPDCLGIYGIAREVHAITGAPIGDAPWQVDIPGTGAGHVSDHASVEVEVPELCPRFTAGVFTGIQVGPSPEWLRSRLKAAGQRPINNVVDITNYVMLLTGQPLHAFDLDRVAGSRLTVRGARRGETLVTLDDVERELPEGTVVVCDDDGPAAIAGIMGGAGTEVTTDTSTLLLEVASWNGPDILRSSRELALRSEASARFEKQLHPDLCDRAQRIAARLLIELCGAVPVPGMLDLDAERFEPRRVDLRLDRAEAVLGMEVPPELQVEYLKGLGCGVVEGAQKAGNDAEDGATITVDIPPDRYFDLTREADLVEEVGRIHGLDKLVPSLPTPGGALADSAAGGGLDRSQMLRRGIEDHVCALGFDEIVGWSFTDPGEPERLGIDGAPAEGSSGTADSGAVRLANPLSTDQSVLRTTLLGSLLDAAGLNSARGAGRIALFESGRVYRAPGPSASGNGESAPAGEFGGTMRFPGDRHGPPALEAHRLGALSAGPIGPSGWDGHPESAGFYSLKGVLEALGRGLGLELAFEPAHRPYLHPGRAASVILESGGTVVGWLGEVHPNVCARWDLEHAVAFELDLEPVIAASGAGMELFEDVATHPAVYQDLAVVVPEPVTASQVKAAVMGAGAPLLRRAEVFDLFRGDQIGEGKKSLALQLEFRASERTLTDEEVAEIRAQIEACLPEIGGSIRG